MSQNCDCDTPTVEMPVMGLKLSLPESIFPNPGEPGTGVNTWQSDWFDIKATSAFDFTHNLNLEKPWLCMPRIVGRVKTASGGWAVGEILFCDGDNYVGNTSAMDVGWVISVDANSAHVAFGNSQFFHGILRAGGCISSSQTLPKTTVECKLVISY